MLRSINLENYRGFSHYQLNELSRVNLLVGMNNCGKISVLEAVHLLASGPDPLALTSIAERRGELIFVDDDRKERFRRRVPAYADVSHFFHGHEFGLSANFTVSSDDGLGKLTVSVVDTLDGKEQPVFFEEDPEVSPDF